MEAVLFSQAEMLLKGDKFFCYIFLLGDFTIWCQFTGGYIITSNVFPDNSFQASVC